MVKYLPILLLFSCDIDREKEPLSKKDTEELQSFSELDNQHICKIGQPDEPGERLILCLRFVDASSLAPVQNRRIHFYHADINGQYQPRVATDESTARLGGEASTDELGRIFLQTTLPGDYGSSTDNRHIHTTVFGARPKAYDIHFKQYTGFMGNRFISSSDQHFLADLKKDTADNMVAFLTIEVKNP